MSPNKNLRTPRETVVGLVAITLSLYHVTVAYIGTPISEVHLPIHLALVLIVIFWKDPLPPRGPQRQTMIAVNVGFSFISIASCAYIILNANAIQQRMIYIDRLTLTELLLSVLLLVSVLEAARRTVGWVLILVILFFLAYGVYGYLLPYPLWHRGFSPNDILETIYLTQDGLWGVPLSVTANFIFLFILFGALLVAFGAADFFAAIARRLTTKMVGGAAKTAVVSSALMGTLSGSSAANVVVTGSFTIPAMRAVGYRREFAAAVEAVASAGGQFMPPIMGSAAFIMMEFMGVPYATIMMAGVIPAMLYFGSVFLMVDLEARRSRIALPASDEVVTEDTGMLRSYGYLLLPVVALTILIVQGSTPARAAFWSIVTLVVAHAVFVRPNPKEFFSRLTDAFISAPKLVASVTVACAAGGILIGIVTLTGLGLRMSTIVLETAESSLLLLLVLTMIAAVVLGMGMPTSGAYIILAVLLAPGLIEFGISDLSAHMFLMYCAGVSAITPPVALASFAAAGVAGASPWSTSLVAFRLGLVSFIIPFMFVYGPSLLGQGDLMTIILTTCTAAIGIFALAVAIIGWFLVKLPAVLRLVFLSGSLLMIKPGIITDGGGIILITAGMLYSVFIRRLGRQSVSAST